MIQQTARTCLIALCLCGASLLVPSTAGAQNTPATCIPFGDGGAFAPGPPTWFNPSGAGFARFNTWVDDPRWLGATGATYGDGTTNELQFRALFNPQTGAARFVYASWWYKASLNPIEVNNRLYVGLKSATGTTALLLRIQLSTISHTTAGVPTVSVHPVNSDGTFGSALTPVPSWTNDIRAWVEEYTDQTTANPPQATNAPEQNNWAIHVRIPIGQNLGTAANNVTLGSPFLMWYELLQGTPNTPVISYTWPRPTATQQFGVTDGANGEQLPPTSAWPSFALSGTGCKGVDIVDSDIKVTFAGGTTETIIKEGVDNTFTATPTNKTDGDVLSNKITARFRIAKWGIQPNTADQADPSTGAWVTAGNLGSVTQTGATIPNNGKWNIAGPWNPPAGTFGGLSTHQCVMVELSGPNDVEFLHSSAFRNMHVQSASLFRDSPVVSVVGLPAAATPNRDVYLYVQTTNMPASIVPGRGPGSIGLRPVASVATTGGRQTPDQQAENQRERTEYERRQELEPTYIVRAYFDTGRRITINGKQRPVLQSMVSFGYFMEHVGALYGWDHALSGAEKIGPNFYVIRVPNNGEAPISVSIEALDQPRGASWAVWVAFGATFPRGEFATDYDSGSAINLGVERAFNPTTAMEGTLGFHRFSGKSGIANLDVTQLALNGKWYLLPPRPLRAFLTVGIGAYTFDPGSTRFGVNGGIGVQSDLAPPWSLEGRYTFIGVTSNAPNSRYHVLQFGLRYGF